MTREIRRTDLYAQIDEAIRQGRPDAPDLLRHPRVRRHRKSLCERWLKLAVELKRIEVIDVLEVPTSTPCLMTHDFGDSRDHNDLEFLKYLVISKGLTPCADFPAQVAATGNIAILEWLHELQPHLVQTSVSCAAAAAGHVHVLKWFKSKTGYPNHHYSDITVAAAAAGRMEVLQWCRETGIPIRSECAAEASRNGHLEVVQWLDRIYPHLLTPDCTYNAATGGYLELLQWVWDRRTVPPSPVRLAWHASIGGHLNVLEYLVHRTNTTPKDWGSHFVTEAIQRGHLKVLQWTYRLFGVQCVGGGHINLIVQWSTQETRLDILKWFDEIGNLHWTGETLEGCLWRDDLEVTQWALSHGCPSSEANFMDVFRNSVKKQVKNQSFLWALMYCQVQFRDEFCIRRIQRLLRYQFHKKQFGFMCQIRNSSVGTFITPEQHRWMGNIIYCVRKLIISIGVSGPLEEITSFL